MPSYTVHLDRRYQLTGSYGAPDTTWTLPFADTFPNCLVVGETHADTGLFYTRGVTVSGQTGTFTLSGTTVTVAGKNYSSIPCVIGTLYTMTLTPTRAFAVDQNGAPDPVARVQVHGLDVSYHLSAGFDVVRTMTGRTAATRSCAGPTTGAPTGTGVYRALLNGNTKDASWAVSSTSPKRVVIPSIQFHTDTNDRRKV